jgi:Lar family restriction alleviation protein
MNLKPCPFCGSTSIEDEDCSTMQTNGTRLACNGCGAMVEGYGASTCTARATAKWNSRVESPELIAAAREREELNAKLAEEVSRTQYWMHEALGRDSDGDERDAAVRGVVAQRDELAGLLRRLRENHPTAHRSHGVRQMANGEDTNALWDEVDAALAKVGP